MADAERPAVCRLLELVCPDRAAEVMARWDERNDCSADTFFLAVPIAATGVVPPPVIGLARLWRQGPDRARVDVGVAPEHRERGVGSALLAEAERRLAREMPTLLQARADEADTATLSFYRARGFTDTQAMVRLQLDLNCSMNVEGSAESSLAAVGVTITTLSAERLRDPAGLQERLISLLTDAAAGRADPYFATPPDPDPADAGADAQRLLDLGRYQPLGDDCFFLAVHEGRYIGLSLLTASVEAGIVQQGDTAVAAMWRRRGIATTLKHRVIAAARERGLTAIRTNTASPAMEAVNRRLGFRRLGAEVRMVKSV